MIDAAELLGARMDVHQLRLRLGNVEQRVALRRHFAEPAADQQHQVGGLDARQQLRIGPDAEIAGVAGMQRVEQMAAAERGGDRQREALGKARERGAGRLRPAAAADEHDRTLAPPTAASAAALMSVRPGQVSTGSKAGASGTATRSVSMSSGSAITTGPGRPLQAVWKARETISGMRAGSSISVAHFAIVPNTAR